MKEQIAVVLNYKDKKGDVIERLLVLFILLTQIHSRLK